MKCPRPDYTHNGQRVQIEGWTLPKNEYVPPSVRRALWLFMEYRIVDAAELYRQIGHNGIALLEQCVNRYKVELLLWNAPGGLRFTLERWDPCPKTT
jgi:hypothetical protein